MKIVSQMNDGVSFLIFGRDVGSDIFGTLDSVQVAAKNIGFDYEIIIVDDGSSIPMNLEKINFRHFQLSKLIRLDRSVGISGAILKGLPFCRFQHVLPVPGHNMFSTQAIRNVIELKGKGDLIIGCRNNLSSERPLIKRLASRMLRDIYRHLTFYFVGDIHGLILFQKSDLEHHLSMNGKHTNAIRVVTPVLIKGGLLIQTIAPINNGHDNRPSRKFIHSFPAPVNVVAIVQALWWARRKFREKI